MTVLEQLLSSLDSAGIYNQHDTSAPEVVLWTDPERLWESILPRVSELREAVYHLDKDGVTGELRGPSTFLRYQLSKRGEPKRGEKIPIIYLPGVARSDFRSSKSFPEDARHLFAYQYLGNFWTQVNGKDWTPSALLASDDGGLALDLAKDLDTRNALRSQLATVMETEIDALKGMRLEASDFNALSVGDPVRLMLQWLSHPERCETEWPCSQWQAFQEISQNQFGLDPKKDGRLVAAEKLVTGGQQWDEVWARYEEAPRNYSGVLEALDHVKPSDLFVDSSDRIPRNNREKEEALRKELVALTGAPAAPAQNEITRLSSNHRSRAASVWAELDQAPLAHAIRHLGEMVEAMQKPIQGSNWAALQKGYLSHGWQVDAHARRAFASVEKKVDQGAITAALQACYLPWLSDLAERTQKLAAQYPNPSPETAPSYPVEEGSIYLFIDGLRADLALELVEGLENAGMNPKTDPNWAALPSVTATAKPAWQGLTERLNGDSLGDGFEPINRATGKALTTASFRKQIGELAMKYVPANETGDHSGCSWTEAADFDSRGHKDGAKLAWRIQEELRVVHQRVNELFQAGWSKITIITDHGWLWMPGGLPCSELPGHLTASKWGRCAILKEGTVKGFLQVPWFWDSQHAILLPPSVNAFRNGLEYSHGGLSLQETVTLQISLKNTAATQRPNVTIANARWVGLRLKFEIEGETAGLSYDLRTKPADASSTQIEGMRDLNQAKVSLAIEDDELDGTSVMLVILHSGEVIAKKALVVGENQ